MLPRDLPAFGPVVRENKNNISETTASYPTSLKTAVLSAVSGITGKLNPHFGQG